MIAATKLPTELPRKVDTYLGFDIVHRAPDSFVAIPNGWTPLGSALLEAHDLPALRKAIWSWWHRPLD